MTATTAIPTITRVVLNSACMSPSLLDRRKLPMYAETRTVSGKSLIEARVVAYGGEIVVSARVLAEPREQLDCAPEVAERLVAGVAREGREAGVVVMKARVV